MDTALHQKFLFILDRNLAKANCTGNQVCTSCDIVVFVSHLKTLTQLASELPISKQTFIKFNILNRNYIDFRKYEIKSKKRVANYRTIASSERIKFFTQNY